MDDKQNLLNEPEPRPDTAAQAFGRLEARVSGMEQRLDGRLSMLTRAVEHITVERQSLEIPDYSPTLAKHGGHLAAMAGQMKRLADAPAMQLTPESMAERMLASSEAAREPDKTAIKQAQALHRESQADLMGVIGTVRTKHEQRWHMLYAGIGTALAVSLLWLLYPGWAASIGPESWHWPERVARRVLGEATAWDAGIRLMRADNPKAWQAIVNAADMARENRDALATCQKAASKAKEPVRCTIRVGAPQL
jgi:hypothetical protein